MSCSLVKTFGFALAGVLVAILGADAFGAVRVKTAATRTPAQAQAVAAPATAEAESAPAEAESEPARSVALPVAINPPSPPPLQPPAPAPQPPAPEFSEPPAPLPRAADFMNYPAAALLGIVEGLTEYLPVSSTGHLILVNEYLGLNEDVPVAGRDGEPLFTKLKDPPPVRLIKKLRGVKTEPLTVPFTLKNAADAYVIVIQFGAILAVLFAYWGRISGTFFGLFARGTAQNRNRKRASWLLVRNLLVAFLPAAILGFLFNKVVENALFGIVPIIVALFLGGVVMLFIEKWYRRRRTAARRNGATKEDLAGPDLHELPATGALGIGLAQCVALCPGTSRSMATICGGYLVGLSPARATEFSFLLGLVTLTCATLYKVISSGKNMLAAFDTGPLALGIIVAGVTAFFAVKWFVEWINQRGMALFGWYRIALSAVLTALLLAGWL
jgi:undecaprenyl-diphosphatase